MARRNPVCWLMTDERAGERLWPALRRLPPRSGVVFRHHATPPGERRALLRRVERIAAARRLVLMVAGGGTKGRSGSHGAGRRPGPEPHSRSAHDRREARMAVRAGVTWLFVSPVRATRSHPGAAPLGARAAARIARAAGPGVVAVALGGMDARGWRRIRRLGFGGWAAIDAWTADPDQKRKVVPT